ncbi:MAG TPA: choice-of-anchor tandem repeat GloVer-containing protein, partial [Methylomirabilota bacterium]|nr:choice-of-anchor tandem repeat GloVer-containing protein [Methylomirabilota bacterium]
MKNTFSAIVSAVLSLWQKRSKPALLPAMLVVFGLAWSSTITLGQVPTEYQLLRSFGIAEQQGTVPTTTLFFGSDNRLYGFTAAGGISNGAVIYRINPDGTDYRVLHAYPVGGPNTRIIGALFEGSDGLLYGTVPGIGTNNAGNHFSMNKDGTGYTILRPFDAGVGAPYDLLEGSDGLLYGWGTGSNALVVQALLYRMNKDGSGLATMHSFDVYLGLARLFEGSDGVLYGSAYDTRNNGQGFLFKINRDGSGFAVIRNIGVVGLFEGRNGRLYFDGMASINRDGTGYTGYNTVFFPMQPPQVATNIGTVNTLEGQDGLFYFSSAIFSTNLTIVTTVMRVGGNGGEAQLLHVFDGSPYDGGGYTRLIQGTDGTLYGTTLNGGKSDVGTIFKMQTNGLGYTVLWNFSRTGGDGSSPFAPLMQASDGALYGSTVGGGSYNNGTAFRLTLDGNLTHLHHFIGYGLDGTGPSASLVEGTDGLLYGVLYASDTNTAYGAIFRMGKDGSGYQMMRPFTHNSYRPVEIIEGNDGLLYGVTLFGNISGRGSVFRMNKDGGGYTNLTYFGNGSAFGSSPVGIEEGNNGALYVACTSGGTNGNGTVFRINKNGTGLVVLRHFRSGGAGEAYLPRGGLLQASDGFLYGTTGNGGANNKGTLYRMAEDGSDYQVLWSFGTSLTDSASPTGPLVENPDGFLYGTTGGGGTSNRGTVYRVRKSGTEFLILRSKTEAAGESGGVCAASNGLVYGITGQGGQSGFGTLFSLLPGTPGGPLQPLPQTTNVAANATFSFMATGGVPPYAFSPIRMSSGGTILSNGLYTAGSTSSVDSVRLRDALGVEVTAFVSVRAGPTAPFVGPTHRYSFANNPGAAANGAVVPDLVGTAHGAIRGTGATFTGSRISLPGGPSTSAPYVDFPNRLLSSNSVDRGGSGKVTIEGWVRLTGPRAWGRIFDFGATDVDPGGSVVPGEVFGPGGGGEGREYLAFASVEGANVNRHGLQLRYLVPAPGNDQIRFYDVANFGQDLHFAVTWNEATGEILVYENGVAVNAIYGNHRISRVNDVNVWLGRSNWSGDENLQGDYDEFRIYNYVLSPSLLNASFLTGPNQLPTPNPIAFSNQPLNQTTVELGTAAFSVSVTGYPPHGFQWFKNNNPVAGPMGSTLSLSNIPLGDHGAQFYCVVSNNVFGTPTVVTSLVAMLTVNADISPPTVVQARFNSPREVEVIFSEAVAGADGTNASLFVFSGPPAPPVITNATLRGGRRVVLSLNSAASVCELYRLEVVGVRDTAAAANALPPTTVPVWHFIPSGLQHRYTFNTAPSADAGGMVIADVVTNGNGIVRPGSVAAALNGDRILLPGGSSLVAPYVDLPNRLLSTNSTNNAGSGQVTFEGWAKVTGNHIWSRIFDIGSAGPCCGTGSEIFSAGGNFEGIDYLTYTAQLESNTERHMVDLRNRDESDFGATATDFVVTNLNQDFHFVLTWDEETGAIKAYENGVLAGTTTTA